MNKLIKIFGLAAVFAYMVVILGNWIYWTTFNDIVYVPFGEPNLYIKHAEWAGGIIGIVACIVVLKEEVDGLQTKKENII